MSITEIIPIEVVSKHSSIDGQINKRIGVSLPYFLLLIPYMFGSMLAISGYDKYIKVSFPSAFLGQPEINYWLWTFTMSLFPLGGCITTYISTVMAIRIGERLTTLIFVIVGIFGSIGYVVSYFTGSYVLFSLSRLIFGLAAGGTMGCGILLVYQMVQASHHFILSFSVQLALNVGLLMSGIFCLEDIIFRNWYVTAIPLIVVQMISVWTLVCLPDSPLRVFKETRDVEKLKTVLRSIRMSDESEIIRESSTTCDIFTSSLKEEKISLRQLLGIKRFRNQIVIVSLSSIFQQVSGINIAIWFSTNLVNEAGFERSDVGNVILLLNCLLGAIVFSFVIPRFGTKRMLVIGHFMMGISYSIAFILKMTEKVSPLITVFMMAQFLFWFQSGPGPKPWVLFSETFDREYQASAQGLISICNWLSNFLLTVLYGAIGKYIEFYIVLIFGLLNIIFALTFVIFMVETKGKSPTEICQEYGRQKYRCFP